MLAARLLVLALLSAGLTACSGGSDRGSSACALASGGADREFWSLIAESCRTSSDGDAGQAAALTSLLEPLGAARVAAFQRTLVRLSEGLAYTAVGDVADDICLPGLGLGDDLGTDYRSWIIAHGEVVYQRVRATPSTLRELSDARAGCGMGEAFSYSALDAYDDLTGTRPGQEDLPTVDG